MLVTSRHIKPAEKYWISDSIVLLQKLHIVETDLGQNMTYQGGWGYIEFKDHEAAVEGMKRRVLLL